jgi:hypothetical protein
MMNSSRIAWLLLIGIMACTNATSCKPSESQAIAGKQRPQASKRVLSNQELIDIATAAGPHYGCDPEEWTVRIDKENAAWRNFAFYRCRPPSYDELDAAIVKRWPMLKDHDYQALWYDERPPAPKLNVIPFTGLDTETVIFIDKNTGEILVVLGAFGQVLSPCIITELEINKGLTERSLRQKLIAVLPPVIVMESKLVERWSKPFEKASILTLENANYQIIDPNEVAARIKGAYEKDERLKQIAPQPRMIGAYLAGPDRRADKADEERANRVKVAGECLGVGYLLRQIVEDANLPASGDMQRGMSMKVDVYDVQSGSVVFHIAGRTPKRDEADLGLAFRLSEATLGRLSDFTSTVK